MGTSPKRDRFVVVTDGQELMHLDLFWRDEIPADWKGLPGEVPVDFGDPNATTSQSEQSVLVRGYGTVVVNNQLEDDSAFAALPGNARLLAAALAGGDPNNAPYGMQRIDWNPKTRTCKARWANRDVSIPNGIPSMSTDTGLIYGIGQRDGTWGLEGVDFKTGASKLRVDSTATPDNNAAYAATTIGPDGAIWTGTLAGFTIFRGPTKAAPKLACLDSTPPISRVRTAASRRVEVTRLTARQILVAGPTRDRACGEPSPRAVDKVEVALARRVVGGCRAVTGRGRLRAKTRPCAARIWLRARLRDGRSRFLLSKRARLPKGRYLVVSRASDQRGNREAGAETVTVRVR